MLRWFKRKQKLPPLQPLSEVDWELVAEKMSKHGPVSILRDDHGNIVSIAHTDAEGEVRVERVQP